MRKIALSFLFISMALILYSQDKQNEFEELANGYFNQGKLTQAAEFYSKSGYAYWNKGVAPKAAEMFQKSYELFSKQGNVNASYAISNNLGLIYLDAEKYANAYNAFSNALTYAHKLKNNQEIFNSLINVGTVALELSSFSDAIAKSNEAVVYAKELNTLKSIAKCYSLLAESYEKMGDASNAYKYYEMFSTVDKKLKEQEMLDLKNMSTEEINKAHEKKRVTEIELKIKTGELKLTQDSLTVSERLSFERKMQIELRNSQLREKEVQLRYEKNIRNTLLYGITIILVFLLILGYLLRQKLYDNKMLKLQKEEITIQRNKLDTQNHKITDSIHYGLRIQQAMLPAHDKFDNAFESFIIYRPKDIVSGDFYWFHQVSTPTENYQFLAVIDCTGHGVPGAFMSMIGHRLLSEIVVEGKIYQPSDILTEIHERLQRELNSENKKTMDGMDIAMCRFEFSNHSCNSVVFAGAKRQLLIYHSNTSSAELVDGDHKAIGGLLSSENKAFSEKHIKISSQDIIVLFSDGIIDQQNSTRHRFGTPRFVSLVTNSAKESMNTIKTSLENEFDNFKGVEEQRDDITVLGVKII
jgi:serine phosphatase RsbU (regulator of sigma subunit)/tetratricopeptide (TPR) repeat protein